MKTERNILIAFILNLGFALLEFMGGIFTGSVAIVSDAIHDIGDAASIGISYFLEKKSKTKPDEIYTFGYARYSIIGSLITIAILIFGSFVMIYNSIRRIILPTPIHYNGMLIFALIGVCVNFCAAYFTHGGESLNQKAVNLHMLEDVLGWIVVLIGAIIMRLTSFSLIDPLMSIGVSIFILTHAIEHLKEIFDLLLEKVPDNIDITELKMQLGNIEGLIHVENMHIWSIDRQHHYATMHIAAESNPHKIKSEIREILQQYGIEHTTIEVISQITLKKD